ncbi:hypothetical protein TIFTF001_025571 [Ficus carica]|uniref:Uncharacterized protein n=1 Tax=Ficus carica TaxID=3494 RepID=A0AA88AK29_FICCA|nr:hypothetical protein TIFTF001_025571 [Ficus carica]
MKETTTTMASRPSSSSKSASTSSKRLLFDRRYGWVIDEWKHPSEEALTGGRGMFCILPLARSLLKMASQSIDLAASSAVKALEKPDVFSPQGPVLLEFKLHLPPIFADVIGTAGLVSVL